MPPYETLTVETSDQVCHIGLNRPRKRNAFSLAMLRELSEAFTAFDDDKDARCAGLFPTAATSLAAWTLLRSVQRCGTVSHCLRPIASIHSDSTVAFAPSRL